MSINARSRAGCASVASRITKKIVAYVRARGLAAERAAKRSALCTDEEARLLGRRIAAIADEIERGLHL